MERTDLLKQATIGAGKGVIARKDGESYLKYLLGTQEVRSF